MLALLEGNTLRRRIQTALAAGKAAPLTGSLLFASSWRELADLISQHPGSPAFVDPGLGANNGSVLDRGGLAGFDWGTVPLIWCGRSVLAEQDVPGRLGFPFTTRLKPDIDDDIDGIGSATLRSVDARVTHRLLARMRESVDPGAQAIFERALRLAVAPCTVPQLAVSMGIIERTLQRRCIALGIPSPKTLISLARIFTVERLVDWSRQPPDVVTLALGMSDRSNYRRLVLRVLGASPAVIRAGGGSDRFAELVFRAFHK